MKTAWIIFRYIAFFAALISTMIAGLNSEWDKALFFLFICYYMESKS